MLIEGMLIEGFDCSRVEQLKNIVKYISRLSRSCVVRCISIQKTALIELAKTIPT